MEFQWIVLKSARFIDKFTPCEMRIIGFEGVEMMGANHGFCWYGVRVEKTVVLDLVEFYLVSNCSAPATGVYAVVQCNPLWFASMRDWRGLRSSITYFNVSICSSIAFRTGQTYQGIVRAVSVVPPEGVVGYYPHQSQKRTRQKSLYFLERAMRECPLDLGDYGE